MTDEKDTGDVIEEPKDDDVGETEGGDIAPTPVSDDLDEQGTEPEGKPE
jgi:hypothetical protein